MCGFVCEEKMEQHNIHDHTEGQDNPGTEQYEGYAQRWSGGGLGGLGGKEPGVLMGAEGASELGRQRGGACLRRMLGRSSDPVWLTVRAPPVFQLRYFVDIISFNLHNAAVSQAPCVLQFYR